MRRGSVGMFSAPKPKLVAGGQLGNIFVSSDGVSWTGSQPSAFGSTGNVNDVIWVPELSLWVAVADSGVIATSPDGLSWTVRDGGFGTSIVAGVAWSASLGLLVAVGQFGKTATSTDGITWTQRSTPYGQLLRKVEWSFGATMFVAVGDTTTGQGVVSSPDGITWTVRSSTITGSQSIMDVSWSPGQAKFLIAAATGTMSLSTNGTTSWTNAGAVSTSTLSLAFSATAGRWVQVGNGNSCFYSTNGTVWTSVNAQFGTSNIQAVCWSNDLQEFVAVGQSGKISTSPDGATWTSVTTSYTGYFTCVGSK